MPSYFSSYGPAIVIFVGVLISAAGGIWSAVCQNHANQERDTSARALAEHMINEQHRVTGGDAYCLVGGCLIQGNSIRLQLVHRGEFPLYDFRVRVYKIFGQYKPLFKGDPADPIDQFHLTGNLDDLRLAMDGDEFSLDNFQPGDNARFIPNMYQVTEDTWFKIRYSARNGEWEQDYSVRWRNDQVITASCTKRDGVIVEEKIEDGFPRLQNGDIDW